VVARLLEGAIIILTPLFLARIMCPGISASLSEPAYAIFSSWPKKTRSRRLSETLEDHKRCDDRTDEVKRLRRTVRELRAICAVEGIVLM